MALPLVTATAGGNLLRNGSLFYAFGFSYGFGAIHPHREYLDYPKEAKLAEINGHMELARSLGANVLRIRVEPRQILKAPDQKRPVGPWAVRQLLDAAEANNLYVDLTGLYAARLGLVPPWYDDVRTYQQRWAMQGAFWRYLTDACGDSSAILQYETITEPISPTVQVDSWYTAAADYPSPQYIIRNPNGKDPGALAASWLSYVKGKIRENDPSHLVSFGSLPYLAPFHVNTETADIADSLTPHIYPKGTAVQRSVDQAALWANQGKPVILGETFTLHCGWAALEEFLLAANQYLDGALTFFDGRPPDVLKAAPDPLSRQLGQAVENFSAMREALCDQRCGAYP